MSKSVCVLIAACGLLLSVSSSAQVLFGPNMPDVTLDKKAKREAINSLAEALQREYVFADSGENLAKMLKRRWAAGEYGSITSGKQFSELLTRQMGEVVQDHHLRVFASYNKVPPMPPPPPPGQDPKPSERSVLRLKRENFHFERAEHLPGNVGLLKLDEFADADLGAETVTAAMTFLGNTSALIIDLRENHGGGPDMVALLASYFFGTEPVHLNDLSFRKPGTSDREVRESWTLTSIAGKRYLDKEVYVLTSRHTFSAAEEFTYDLQALKRATVVGEATGGGANPGAMVRLGDHLGAFVPRGQAINPSTKTNWEGKGVQPDIPVAQQDALKTAYRSALQHLIGQTSDEQELAMLKRALDESDTAAAPASN